MPRIETRPLSHATSRDTDPAAPDPPRIRINPDDSTANRFDALFGTPPAPPVVITKLNGVFKIITILACFAVFALLAVEACRALLGS